MAIDCSLVSSFGRHNSITDVILLDVQIVEKLMTDPYLKSHPRVTFVEERAESLYSKVDVQREHCCLSGNILLFCSSANH